MKEAFSHLWLDVFPAPRIKDVLSYVSDTWQIIGQDYPSATACINGETALTDSLCHALEDRNRRLENGIDCDFQSETWELRRGPDGKVVRVARADIRVILGRPGTPHLVIEFKKLDGTANARWKYCFDGLNRFVEGKYAVGHPNGVMCGFVKESIASEVAALADYIENIGFGKGLNCIADKSGKVVRTPSEITSNTADFDTVHQRSAASPDLQIRIAHTLLVCRAPALTQAPVLQKGKKIPARKVTRRPPSAGPS